MYCIPDSPGFFPLQSPVLDTEGDDYSDDEEEKIELLNDKQTLEAQVAMFPDSQIAPPSSSFVSLTSRFDSTPKIASNLDLLAGTWLAKPTVQDLESDSHIWSSGVLQRSLPHLEYEQKLGSKSFVERIWSSSFRPAF